MDLPFEGICEQPVRDPLFPTSQLLFSGTLTFCGMTLTKHNFFRDKHKGNRIPESLSMADSAIFLGFGAIASDSGGVLIEA
jgi:hypothetical protein